MFGLELVSTGLFYLAALDSKPSENRLECKLKRPLSIEVVSVQGDIGYDFTKKTAELNRISEGAYSPYGDGHLNVESRGLTVGKQSLDHKIDFYFEKYKNRELACLQIESVKVKINYAATVYVSTKFEEGTPIFNKILEHEKEHIRITKSVNDQYTNILRKRLEKELGQGFIAGPFPIDSMAVEQQKLEAKVNGIIARVDRAMREESQKQNNLFDDAELDETIEYNQGVARRLEEILNINE